MSCSICTGGGRLLKERCFGSTKLTPPSPNKNHSLPSVAFATCGLKWFAVARLRTPSEISKTVSRTIACALTSLSIATAQASSSLRATRNRPQGVYNQNELASSSLSQWTPSHGNPFLLVKVASRPFFNRLTPLSVAIQIVPSWSSWMSFTRPAVSPLAVVYDVWIRPSL